jgi:hypothetical protein
LPGRAALIPERALGGWFFPHRGCGQAGGKTPWAGRRVVAESKIINPNPKMKVIMVEDNASMRKIIRNYLKRNRLENTAPLNNGLLPQAIFWLKK